MIKMKSIALMMAAVLAAGLLTACNTTNSETNKGTETQETIKDVEQETTIPQPTLNDGQVGDQYLTARQKAILEKEQLSIHWNDLSQDEQKWIQKVEEALVRMDTLYGKDCVVYLEKMSSTDPNLPEGIVVYPKAGVANRDRTVIFFLEDNQFSDNYMVNAIRPFVEEELQKIVNEKYDGKAKVFCTVVDTILNKIPTGVDELKESVNLYVTICFDTEKVDDKEIKEYSSAFETKMNELGIGVYGNAIKLNGKDLNELTSYNFDMLDKDKIIGDAIPIGELN